MVLYILCNSTHYMTTTIYQILYDDSQRQHLSTDTRWYDNSNATDHPCLENHVIADLIRSGAHLQSDYFGVLSWAFERKRAVRIDKLLPMVDGSFDVYAFDKMHTHPNLWRKAETWHKGIVEAAREVFESLYFGKSIRLIGGKHQMECAWFNSWDESIPKMFDQIQTPNIYSNAFITRPHIYERYVNNWLIPFMETLVFIQQAKQPCIGYTKIKAKQGVTAEHLQRVTGYPYYTLMPFICERLFSTYLAFNRHLTIKHIA